MLLCVTLEAIFCLLKGYHQDLCRPLERGVALLVCGAAMVGDPVTCFQKLFRPQLPP